jgi:tetratricopeptide (TPR) repeat protein
MSFDKVKAMRNAERYLAQGKIRAAIVEYKSVIESDQNDYSTLNMLGDLYAKASEPDEAIRCFTQVAEHYSKQGFAQKAIAIYNKISRLKPDSLEVSAKLAQLYQTKGSVAEARVHYNTLAEQYTRAGRKAEALAVWKQIANLDPTNTDIYLKIADACWQSQQKEEAASAYIEAGSRLTARKQYESAVTAFSRALEIRPDDVLALKGFVDSQINLGYPEEAAKTLEGSLSRQPYNREIMYLLIDCYLEMGNTAEAEKTTVKMVEQEPANYPKLLDLVKVYLKKSDLESAVRILSMASEHMLVGGQAEELLRLINEILAKNPEQVTALRLLVRLYSWQRDEAQLKSSFEKLAEAAKLNDAPDDEKYALSQLIMISPQNAYYAQRLHELTALNGEAFVPPPTLSPSQDVPTFESFAGLGHENESPSQSEAVFAEYGSDLNYSNGNGNGSFKTEITHTIETDVSVIEEGDLPISETDIQPNNAENPELSEFELHNLQKELEGIDFYVAQGFMDLAEKSLVELEERFGKHSEIDKVRESLSLGQPNLAYNEEIEDQSEEVQAVEEPSVEEIQTTPEVEDSEAVVPVAQEETAEEIVAEVIENVEVVPAAEEIDPPSSLNQSGANLLDEIKSEFGIVENKPIENDDDFETSYQTGIAYKEMGLMEDAIREFQTAVKLVSKDDGTRRFFACCNLLGHCFMEKQMPSIALMWYKRGLEAKNLTEEETYALQYELANAFEMAGDKQKASEYFEQIYAMNVSFRDVGVRLHNLRSA